MSNENYNPLAERAPAIKCENVGDTIKGRITSMDYADDTDPNGEVRRFPSGDARKVWHIGIEIDGEERTIYASAYLQKAIRMAAKKAGCTSFDDMEGAEVWIKRLPDGEPPKKGYNGPKLYECKLKRGAPKPAATDDNYDPFGDE